jgi:hypothetical protein
MATPRLRLSAVLLSAAVLFGALPAYPQSADPKASESRPQGGEAVKEGQKQVDQLAEAGRVLQGPAGNPECVWLGERLVSLLYRDDLDTAFRHLDLYDRFGCPGGHIQAAFRCVVMQSPELKGAETFKDRVHQCWLNQPKTAAPTTGQPAAQNR